MVSNCIILRFAHFQAFIGEADSVPPLSRLKPTEGGWFVRSLRHGYAVPPFHSSTWSPRFVRKAHLRCSLFHWAYFALFRPQGARFVRPFAQGRLWGRAAPYGVPLTKRLPFHKGELSAKLTEGCPIPPSRLAPCHLPFPFGKKEAFGQCNFIRLYH